MLSVLQTYRPVLNPKGSACLHEQSGSRRRGLAPRLRFGRKEPRWLPAAVRSSRCQEGTRTLRSGSRGRSRTVSGSSSPRGQNLAKKRSAALPALRQAQSFPRAQQQPCKAFKLLFSTPASNPVVTYWGLDNPRNTKCNFALHAKSRHPVGLLGYCFLTRP